MYAGGMFIVPVNAALQELGQQSIGSGGAVAMQNFFQNAAMLLSWEATLSRLLYGRPDRGLVGAWRPLLLTFLGCRLPHRYDHPE